MSTPADLLRLARLGDAAALRKQGARLLEPLDDHPYHAWVAAIETDQAAVLELALELGLPVDGPDANDRPLLYAAGLRARQCLELLIRGGANLDLPDEQGRVALSAALMAGDAETVETLLEAGASPFFPGDDWMLARGSFLPEASKPLRRRIRAAREAYLERTRHLRALGDAAASGDGEALERLLQSGAEVDFADLSRGGMTPLMRAAEAGQAGAVERLGRAGASLELRDRASHERKRGRGTTLELGSTFGGWTALHYAAASNRAEAVRALVRCGTDLECGTPAGDRPLHLAAQHGAVEAAEALLELGADANARSAEGTSPLLTAAYLGPTRLAAALLAAGAEVNAADGDGYTPLLAACWEGKTPIARALVKAGARMDAASDGEGDIWDALHLQSRTPTLRAILSLGLDSNGPREEGSPLAAAASYGHLAAIPLLLKRGARPRGAEELPEILRGILEAGWGGDAERKAALEAIAAAGMVPEAGAGESLLGLAARQDKPELLDVLSQMGLPVDGHPDGPAPVAQQLGRRIYEWFVKHGADLSRADENGLTALDHAVLSGDVRSVRLLLQAGADPLHRDLEGRRTVEKALVRGLPGIRRLFRTVAYDPAAAASLRLAQVLSAPDEPKSRQVEQLLAEGADPSVRVFRGYPAALVAAGNGWWEVFDRLQAAGAGPHPLLPPFLALREERGREDPEWAALLRELEAELGVPPAPVEGARGAVSFALDEAIRKRQAELAGGGESAVGAEFAALFSIPKEIARNWRGRTRGFWVGAWRCHPVMAERLLAVPCKDPLVAVALVKPRAGEMDVGVLEMLAKLVEWREALEWTLLGVGYDALSLCLGRLPADLRAFAEELYAFCPDLIDQGFESLEALERSLETTREVHFWWD